MIPQMEKSHRRAPLASPALHGASMIDPAQRQSFAQTDDLSADQTSELLVASSAALEISGVSARVSARAGGPPIRANHRDQRTLWLETLSVDEANALIDSRKAHVIRHHIVAGTRANRTTAMSQYIEVCEIRGHIPIRDTGLVRELTRSEITTNENILIDYAIYQSWRVSPNVVGQYVSHVVNWHLMELGVDIKEGKQFKRLAKVLSSLKKLIPHVKRVRLGLKPSQLKAVLRLLVDQMHSQQRLSQGSRRAYRLILFFCWAFQGLYRGGEGARGADFDADVHLTCADPVMAEDGKTLLVRNPALKVNNQHTGLPFPFPVDANDICSFASWFGVMDKYDPLDADEDPAKTPLFADPAKGVDGRQHGQCLAYADALADLRSLLRRAFPNIDDMLYGLHSLRIGAASALFALGCPPMVIQTLGRWASDLYEIYCRAHRDQLVTWTSRLSSAEYACLEEM